MTERTYVPGLGKQFLTPFYDVVHHVFGVSRIHQRMVTLAELRAGQRVLDVGCGTGNLLRSIGRRHPDVERAGLDPDPAMLARARRKLGPGVRLDRGFAQELPHPDGSFDRVFSSLMLHHLDTATKDALLAEVRRVLRPDGLLVLADAVLDARHHRRMRAHLHDNVGDAVSRRIAAAGFTVEPTRTAALRVGGRIGIELARPSAG
jgi:ubiquinone/menaquinone biosynthesis C-methylase UbiE